MQNPQRVPSQVEEDVRGGMRHARVCTRRQIVFVLLSCRSSCAQEAVAKEPGERKSEGVGSVAGASEKDGAERRKRGRCSGGLW